MAAQEKKMMFPSITLRSAFVIKCNKSPFHYNILGGEGGSKQLFLHPLHWHKTLLRLM